jgi:chromate reductase, NAD(P)H dehydrogenase (quinone)
MTAPRILVLAGSNRSGSFNQQLAASAALTLAQGGADVTRISLADYPLPLMDEDLQRAQGIPQPALNLAQLIGMQDGLFIACPEYNASIPPLLKNAIDWVSRVPASGDNARRAWTDRVVALGSASNGRFAGIRALYHLRAVLMAVGAQVISQQCSVGEAATAFDGDGLLRDQRNLTMLQAVCDTLIETCRSRMVR